MCLDRIDNQIQIGVPRNASKVFKFECDSRYSLALNLLNRFVTSMGGTSERTVRIGTPLGTFGSITCPKQLSPGCPTQAFSSLIVKKLSITMAPVPSVVEETTAVSPGAKPKTRNLAANGSASA